jgi:hypothetical protein
MSCACVGFGAALLRGFGVLADMDGMARIVWSFAIGLGALGWLAFFAGIAGFLATTHLIVLCLIGLPGLLFLTVRPRPSRRHPMPESNAHMLTALLGAGLLLAAAINLVQALAPPADADTLAYHFALPQKFLAEGRIEFVPRAVDGAVPLLLQSTYLIALALGGELAVTLWVALISAAAVTAFFVFARQFLSLNPSLALTLILLTTPATIYGSGSGQVEPKIMLFVLAAAHAVVRLNETGRLGYAAVVGLGAGYYAGAKYLGLLFVAASALALITNRNGMMRLALFGGAVLVAGSQWYFWNWYHTGDPIFPALYSFLNLPDTDFWTQAWAVHFRQAIHADENPIPKAPWLFLTYPFIATLTPPADIDAGRVGLGPFCLLALPFAAAGAWRFKRRLVASRYFAPALILAAFYLLWIYLPSSQRVRHLLPVYPLLLLGLCVLAIRWADRREFRSPLVAAFAATIVLQLGGHAIFAQNYVQRLLKGESRDTFLARNVSSYAAVPWINTHLTASDKILIVQRELAYLIEIPVFVAHTLDQILIQPDFAVGDPQRLLEQLRRQSVTHVLYFVSSSEGSRPMERFIKNLVEADCGRNLAEFKSRGISSRALQKVSPGTYDIAVFALADSTCKL